MKCCGTCRWWRDEYQDGEWARCYWSLDNKAPPWAFPRPTKKDDGQDCPCWEKRDDS